MRRKKTKFLPVVLAMLLMVSNISASMTALAAVVGDEEASVITETGIEDIEEDDVSEGTEETVETEETEETETEAADEEQAEVETETEDEAEDGPAEDEDISGEDAEPDEDESDESGEPDADEDESEPEDDESEAEDDEPEEDEDLTEAEEEEETEEAEADEEAAEEEVPEEEAEAVVEAAAGVAVLSSVKVLAESSADSVCKIGDGDEDYYDSIAQALEAIKDDGEGTVTLLKDVEENVTIDSLTVTLDLGGYTLSGTLNVKGGADVTVQNGTVDSGSSISWIYASGNDDNPTTFTLAEDAEITANGYGLCICGVTSSSDHDGTGFLVTIDGTIESDGAGMWLQGNMTNTSAEVCDVIINGTVTGGELGIAINGWGNVTINEDAVVSGGETGIEIRAGSLTVNGGEISGGINEFSDEPNTSGSTASGAGIAIDEHTTDLEITVIIYDGEITGYYAIEEDDVQGMSGEKDHITLIIEGGTFTGYDEECAIRITDYGDGYGVFSITGGTFIDSDGNKSDISDYLADGYVQDDKGEVTDSGMVCEVNGVKYPTIAAALEAIGENGSGTITLLQDVSESIVIASGMTVTLDLNGCTLSDDGDEVAVGEGMHYAATIENYGTLTITGEGTVDCTKANCAALINCVDGICTIKSGTFERSTENGKYDNWTDETNSCYTIVNNGTMLIKDGTFLNDGTASSLLENGFQDDDQDANGSTASLIINGGTFTGGDCTIKSGDDSKLVINDGTFTNSKGSGNCVLAYENCEINGGTFNGTGDTIMFSPAYADDSDKTYTLTITGGVFTSSSGHIIHALNGALGIGESHSGVTVTIEGGKFIESNENTSIIYIPFENLTGITFEIYCGIFSNEIDPANYLATENTGIADKDGYYEVYTATPVVVEPTCTTGGYTSYVCDYCGDEFKTNETAALGHDYSDEGVTFSWSDDGTSCEATFTCTACGDETTVECNVVETASNAASCTEDGSVTYEATASIESRDDETVTVTSTKEVTVAALGHDWGEWVITKEATETEDGEQERTCSRCGEEETEKIPATGAQPQSEPEPEPEPETMPDTEILTLKIVDKNGKVAIGVVFELYSSEGELIGTYTQGSSEIVISELPEDTYTVVITNKNGYVFGSSEYSIEVSSDMTYTIQATNAKSTSSGGSSGGGGSSSSSRSSSSSSVAQEKSGKWILEGALFTYPDGTHPSNCYLNIDGEIWAFYTNGYAVNKSHESYYTAEAIAAAGNIPTATGTWEVCGWWYLYDDGTYPHNEWAQLTYNGQTYWYHFDVDGWMDDGWFNEDGNTYYLDPVYDGYRGHMITGWKQIDGYWYYFESNGALLKNGTTPDGYSVDANGRWIE